MVFVIELRFADPVPAEYDRAHGKRMSWLHPGKQVSHSSSRVHSRREVHSSLQCLTADCLTL